MNNNLTYSEAVQFKLAIHSVCNLWHFSTTEWSRNYSAPRTNNGLIYFTSGGIEYHFTDRTLTATEGQFVLLPKGIPYSGVPLTDGIISAYVIDFVLCDGATSDIIPLPGPYTPTNNSFFLEKVKELFNANIPDTAYNLKIMQKFYELIYLLCCDYLDSKHQNKKHVLLNAVLKYIRDNLTRSDLNISEISAFAAISDVHLRRIFHSELGVSPHGYIMNARLKLACEHLLSMPDATICDIAELSGFSNVYYFSAAFKKSLNMTPSEYKRKHFA